MIQWKVRKLNGNNLEPLFPPAAPQTAVNESKQENTVCVEVKFLGRSEISKYYFIFEKSSLWFATVFINFGTFSHLCASAVPHRFLSVGLQWRLNCSL